MQVQVNQAQVLALSQIRRNHPKLDGAISADHNRNVPLAHGFRQMRLGFPDAGSDCLPVLREQIRSIGTPSPHRKIAVIDDRQTFLRSIPGKPASRKAWGAFSCPGPYDPRLVLR